MITKRTLPAFFTLFVLLLFVSLNNLAQQATIDAYKIEAEGYYEHPAQTPFGVIVTDNKANSLYIINNGKLEELISAPGCGRYYTISPDKKLIGFKYIDENKRQAPALLDLRTREVKLLHKPVELCGQVSFSQKGDIAFTINEKLHVLNKGKKNIYDLGYYANIAPVSPDGSRAIFNNNDDQLQVIDLQTGEISRFTDNRTGYAYPQWSPDGKKIAFTSIGSDLYVFHKGETYSFGKGQNAVWSDDSQQLLFARHNTKDLKFLGSDIFIANFDGTNQQNLTETENIHEMTPAFGLNNEIIYQTYNQKEVILSSIANTRNQIVLFSHKGKVETKSIEYDKESAKTRANVYISGVPYVNQVWDTPDFHSGYASCAPSTAIMAIGFMNKLPKWEITITKGWTHTNNYGGYVADKYYFNDVYYDWYSSSRNGWGGFGYMWESASPNSRMRGYIENHDMESVQHWSGSWSRTIGEIDNYDTYPLCVMLTSSGHLILTRGYVQGQHTLIFNDPYGDKNNSSWPNYYGYDSYYDWPGYNNGYENLQSVAWTVTARGSLPTYDNLQIEDYYYDHGFYMYNSSPSKMRYFRHVNQGHEGRSWWTATTASGDNVAAVKWTPNLPSSTEYEVLAYIPAYAEATSAKYKVTHSGGTTTVTIDQTAYNDQWVSLGQYQFSAGQSGNVYLGDVTGASGQKLVFDAVKWQEADPIPAPTLVTPADNATNQTAPVNFTWEHPDLPNADYRIQVSTSLNGWTPQDGFTSGSSTSASIPVNCGTSTDTEYSWSATSYGSPYCGPQPNTTYYWTVRAYRADIGVTEYSTPKSFTTWSESHSVSISCPAQADAGESVAFSGTASAYVANVVVTVDGAQIANEQVSNGSYSFNYTFNTAGQNREVVATAYDIHGQALTTDIEYITINVVDNSVTITPPYPVIVNESAYFSGTAGGTVNNVIVTVDGWEIANETVVNGAYDFSYSFNGLGTNREVIATAYNSAGDAVATDIKYIDVVNHFVTIDAPDQATIGVSAYFSGAASSAVAYVVVQVDGWEIANESPVNGEYDFSYTFNGTGNDREVIAYGYDASHNLVDTDTQYMDVVASGAGELQATAMADIENGANISIYPNPAAHYAIIEFDVTKTSDTRIMIYDIQGKQIYHKELPSARGLINQKIDVSTMQEGMYLIKVETANDVITKKLMIKH